MSVEEYFAEFTRLAKYLPALVATEEERAMKFKMGLKHAILVKLVTQDLPTVSQVMTAARAYEGYTEKRPREEKKTSTATLDASEKPAKKPNTGSHKTPSHPGAGTGGPSQNQS